MPPLRVPNLWVGWQSSPSETGNDDRVCRPRDAFGREGVTPHPVSFPGLWVLGQVSSWPGSACLLPFGEVSASVTQVWKEGMTVCTSHPHRPSNSWSGCRPHPLVTGRDDLIYRGWCALGREDLTPYPVSIPGLRGLGGQASSWRGSTSLPPSGMFLPV